MQWEHVFTFIGINVGIFAMMAGLVVWAVNKLDSDIKSLASHLDGHASRIDQVYQMFIALLKENKGK